MKITEQPRNLRHPDINAAVFRVPLYQREYAWELTQISDLFYDIDNSNETGHFLGSLLLYEPESGSNIKEVIDGQQRLTSIFLILHGIKQILKKEVSFERAVEDLDNFLYIRTINYVTPDKNTEPRLTIGKRDRWLFEAIIKEEETKDHKKKYKSHKLLVSALEDFIIPALEKIKKEQKIEGILSYMHKVFNSHFIIMTAQKSSDRMLLFKTINARGMELSESDLIKNEICINVQGIKPEDAVEMWDSMRQTLETTKVNIDVYLYH